MKKILWLKTITFLSAFLLFQIELIISKILLPKFGGTYLVWGACVVFFQCMLLLAYLYSHLVIQNFGISRYRLFHLGLLFLILLFFPGRPLPVIRSGYHIPIFLGVFWQLLLTVGPVFFVLSTTSIIFQGWLAASQLPERSNPYTLYAVSNLGSFAALLTYPFIFEASLDLGIQLNIWRLLYLFLVILHIIAFRLIGVAEQEIKSEETINPISTQEKAYWFLLGAAATIMFLSVTNIITYEITPAPLLWILPLCVYLLSFVLAFRKEPWYPNWIKDKLHITMGFSVLFLYLTQTKILPFVFAIIGQCILLFILCMFCQGELYRTKPRDSRGLTIFYLIISTGGFLGGMFITWVIPWISVSMLEYPFGLFIISLAYLIFSDKKTRIDPYGLRLVVYILFFIISWPMVFKGYNFFGLMMIVIIFRFIYSELRKKAYAFCLSLAVILCLEPLIEPFWAAHKYIYRHRNYYGIYKIYDDNGKRFLMHGTTLHGAQYLAEKKQAEPLTYYHRKTPVGRLMSSGLFYLRRTGVIGLGTGTLSAYIKEGRSIDFFELDPDIFRIAEKYFTYLKNCRGKKEFIFQDARISLNKISDKRYDLLILDAFSGDSIPVHLLTVDAISEYRKRITDKGIILFHISNRYIDLAPILFTNAYALNAYVCGASNKEDPKQYALRSVWVALTWDSDVFQKLISQLKWQKAYSKEATKKYRPWTDEYSNLIPFFKTEIFLSEVKNFKLFYWDWDF